MIESRWYPLQSIFEDEMSANIDNINNANNGSVIENGMSINKMGKRKDKGMEIKDKFGKLDAVNANSLDVFIGGL